MAKSDPATAKLDMKTETCSSSGPTYIRGKLSAIGSGSVQGHYALEDISQHFVGKVSRGYDTCKS